MDVTILNHHCSKSDITTKRIKEDKLENTIKGPHHRNMDMEQLRDCTETKKRQTPSIEIQNSLKDEILQLHKQLENQFLVRSALEKAMSFRPLVHDPTNNNSIAKTTEDLIKEISVLEMEVVYLEKYLLSMYRRTFDERAASLSSLDERSRPNSATHERAFTQLYGNDFTSKKKISATNSSSCMPTQDSIDKPKEHTGVMGSQVIVDSSIHRSHSSLSQRSARSFRTSLPLGTLAETAHLYHSLPLSMLECAEGDTSSVSLAEHLSTSLLKHDWETPNWLSEEMIKCISAIYCQLADPPFFNQDFPSSPISCSSSMSESSLRGQYDDKWSPQHGESSSFNSWLNNPFPSEGSKEFGGSYFTMVEVLGICRSNQSLRDVEHMLQHFRSLVSRLEEVDPRKMKHEEKLAFWINVHNALVMHAFIVYGIPQSNQKRISLLLKAAYIVGGQSISVDMIQSSILGCRLPRPGQWFQFLFSKPKFKAGDARKSFAMDHPQPLLKFALCSGSNSDPPVRMYTPKILYQELEMAKEEYIQSNIKMHKENKILVPKIVESYSKELGLCSAGLFEMIEHCSPDYLRKSFQQGKLVKKVDWIPHDFNFRFLLSRELAK